MAKYRVGERVRYINTNSPKGHWVGQTATVTRVHLRDGYDVLWDDRSKTVAKHGLMIAETSLEPAIDWFLPVELNDGTPLVVLHEWEYHVSLRTRDGRDHPAQPNSPKWRLEARLNNGLVNSNHKFYVRNVIVPQLDTTKPLHFRDSDGNKTPATFITETSEGHVLVTGGSNHWVIFTKEGNYVRSSQGQGSNLTLRNEPRTVERYLTFHKGHCTDPLRHQPPSADDRAPIIKLTLADGIVVAAELYRGNKEPINVD